MSSLRVMAKKGQILLYPGDAAVLGRQITVSCADINCIGVRADSVSESLIIPADGGGWTIASEEVRVLPLPCVPPFPSMWLEFSGFGEFGRGAVLIERMKYAALPEYRKLAKHVIRSGEIDVWTVVLITAIESEGQVCASPVMEIAWLGTDGRINAQTGLVFKDIQDRLGAPIEEMKAMLKLHGTGVIVAMQALARLNCKNVELSQIESIKIHKNRPSKIPMSVWHEIKVTSSPKLPTGGGGVFLEIRILRACSGYRSTRPEVPNWARWLAHTESHESDSR